MEQDVVGMWGFLGELQVFMSHAMQAAQTLHHMSDSSTYMFAAARIW